MRFSESLPNTPGSVGMKGNAIERLILLAQRRKLILWVSVTFAIVAAVVALLLPQYFTATAKILPPQQEQSVAASMLGQLGPLLSMAGGKDLGLRNPNDLYVGMLRSRSVADHLIDRFSLLKDYHKKFRVDARRELSSRTDIVAGRDGIISVSVEDRDPSKAADLANAYIQELENLTRTLAVTDAAKQRLFFEREVREANEQLATAEDELKKTQEATGIIQLDSQSKVLLQGYADLRAQVAAKEVEVESMRSFAAEHNPDLLRKEQELQALRAQLERFEHGKPGKSFDGVGLGSVPGSGLEYVRALREVKYRETLLELLTKQYEIAKIDESKDASIIQVLDQAIAPEKRSWPPRGALVIASTVLGFLLAITFVFLSDSFARARQDPVYSERCDVLWASIGLLTKHAKSEEREKTLI